MKYTGMLVGAFLGSRSRLVGAFLGGVLGYQVGVILDGARKNAARISSGRRGQAPSVPGPNRYPEEEMVEAMRLTEDDPTEQAAELEEIHRSVSGIAGRKDG